MWRYPYHTSVLSSHTAIHHVFWWARLYCLGNLVLGELCGPGSNPGPGVICGLSLFLVLSLLQGFSCELSGFPPSTKTNTSRFQLGLETLYQEPLRGMCHFRFSLLRRRSLGSSRNLYSWGEEDCVAGPNSVCVGGYSRFLFIYVLVSYIMGIYERKISLQRKQRKDTTQAWTRHLRILYAIIPV